MKSIFLTILLMVSLGAYSQIYTVQVQPSGSAGLDVNISSANPNDNQATSNIIRFSRSSGGDIERAFIKFDLQDEVPAGAIIYDAKLTLKGINHDIYNDGVGILQLVEHPWENDDVTWNNSESYRDANQAYVTLNEPSSSSQDYVLNVTSMVQTMVNTPMVNFGWMLYMEDESNVNDKYFEFGASDNTEEGKRPKLEIRYYFPMTLNANVSPSKDLDSGDGAIVVSVSGGVPPYTYLWSNSAESSEIYNLDAGIYKVTVTDALNVPKVWTVPVTSICGDITFTIGSTIENNYMGTARILSSSSNTTNANRNYGSATKIGASNQEKDGSVIITQSLLKFDLSTLPSDAVITQAKLVLTDDEESQPNEFDLKLSRLTGTWNEQTVTYNNHPEIDTGEDDVIFAYNGNEDKYEIDVTAQLQKMLREGHTANGWLLKMNDESTATLGLSAAFIKNDVNHVNDPKIVVQIQAPNFACNDTQLNWIQEETYDQSGTVMKTDKTYYCGLGKKMQHLIKNANNEVFRTENLYDSYGRPAIETLPAFTGNLLYYEYGFTRNNLGQKYDIQHFDGAKLNNPDPQMTGVNNTLGYYYSNNNSNDAYQAIADNPYTRTDYKGQPGVAKRRVSSPGNAYKMGSGHETFSFEMVTGDELTNIYGYGTGIYGSFKSEKLSNNNLESNKLFISTYLVAVKEIVMTPNNPDLITYKVGDKVIATCYAGLSAGEICAYTTGMTNYMSYLGTKSTDIHLPDADKSSLYLPLPQHAVSYVTPASDISYTITDLYTDQKLVVNSDYYIATNRNVVFDQSFLNKYSGKSLVLRVSFKYSDTYLATLASANITPVDASATYDLSYGHHSRNFYDLGGFLRKSVSPLGGDFSAQNPVFPGYISMATTYDYSHYGQLIAVKKPDEGLVESVYDSKGNLRFTQNNVQKLAEKFTYYNYDKHGREVETGECAYTNAANSVYLRNYYGVTTVSQIYSGTNASDNVVDLQDGLLAANKSNATTTSYTVPSAGNVIPTGYSYQSQYQNFRNGPVNFVKNQNSTIWFNYDKADHQTASITQITEADFVAKTSTVDDRIKTSEQSVDYYTMLKQSKTWQKNNSNEKLYLQYTYNTNLKPTVSKVVYGSNTATLDLLSNSYDKLGRLKRVVIGNNYQGLDFVYTIQDRIKAINHPGLDYTLDRGQDNGDYTGTANGSPVNRDLFGEILEYYNNDYQRTGTNIGSGIAANSSSYDGMIYATRFKTRHTVNATTTGADYIDYLGAGQTQLITTTNYKNQELRFDYTYDEFNRLATSSFGLYNNQQQAITSQLQAYAENGGTNGDISYDKNGNVLQLTRQAFGGTVLDDLSYTYYSTAGCNCHNQVYMVSDAAVNSYNSSFNYKTTNPNPGIFTYNSIGQLTMSVAESISNITYYHTGLVKRITYSNNDYAEYDYGANGEKLKAKYHTASSNLNKYTWYLGPMIHEYDENAVSPALEIKQARVDGGIIRVTSGNDITAGYLVFHIKDHLGNVRATFKSNGTGNGIDILSYQDYYAFGGRLPGRIWAAEDFRFAFQGQEKSSDGNIWDHFELREYNHDIGRWFVPDPKAQFDSPYLAMGNNPVNMVDPDGAWINFAVAAGVGAVIGGVGNLVTHMNKGDVKNFKDGLHYFGQGALAGAVVGLATQVPGLGQVMVGYAAVQLTGLVIGQVVGLGHGLTKGDWTISENSLKLFGGNFYIDENRPYMQGVRQGVSRHTSEMLQVAVGHSYAQVQNAATNVERVEYAGGATFAIDQNEDPRASYGISFGNFVTMVITDEITGSFEERFSSDPFFMHEYGHTFDSEGYGLGYLFAIGIPSVWSANRDTKNNTSKHDYFWTERQANRHAAAYFYHHYGVDWSIYEDPKDPKDPTKSNPNGYYPKYKPK